MSSGAGLTIWEVMIDNGGGALSGPAPADGFVDHIPPWRWSGYIGQYERDAKARAWLRWQAIAWQMSLLGRLAMLDVVSVTGGGWAGAEYATMVLRAGWTVDAPPQTEDETGGDVLTWDAAIRRAVARVFVYDIGPMNVLESQATRLPAEQRTVEITAEAPITAADLATAFVNAGTRITVAHIAGFAGAS